MKIYIGYTDGRYAMYRSREEESVEIDEYEYAEYRQHLIRDEMWQHRLRELDYEQRDYDLSDNNEEE